MDVKQLRRHWKWTNIYTYIREKKIEDVCMRLTRDDNCFVVVCFLSSLSLILCKVVFFSLNEMERSNVHLAYQSNKLLSIVRTVAVAQVSACIAICDEHAEAWAFISTCANILLLQHIMQESMDDGGCVTYLWHVSLLTMK